MEPPAAWGGGGRFWGILWGESVDLHDGEVRVEFDVGIVAVAEVDLDLVDVVRVVAELDAGDGSGSDVREGGIGAFCRVASSVTASSSDEPSSDASSDEPSASSGLTATTLRSAST
nr:hypothetical protein GCM10025699_18050 [Microbacterium flavescens]